MLLKPDMAMEIQRKWAMVNIWMHFVLICPLQLMIILSKKAEATDAPSFQLKLLALLTGNHNLVADMQKAVTTPVSFYTRQ